MNKFATLYNIEYRKSMSKDISKKYSEKIPIIVQPINDKIQALDKSKYLVCKDYTVGQFIYILRKRLKFKPEIGLYLFTEKGLIPPSNSLLTEIYQNFKNEDNFLYLFYSLEATFGKINRKFI